MQVKAWLIVILAASLCPCAAEASATASGASSSAYSTTRTSNWFSKSAN